MLALISLSLAVINLFPFLPLDGGHIFWSLVEKVRGRPVPFRVMERAGVVGFVLVMVLFVIGLSNDIGRLTGEGFNVTLIRCSRQRPGATERSEMEATAAERYASGGPGASSTRRTCAQAFQATVDGSATIRRSSHARRRDHDHLERATRAGAAGSPAGLREPRRRARATRSR